MGAFVRLAKTYLRHYWPQIALSIVLTSISSLAPFVFSFMGKTIVDDVLEISSKPPLPPDLPPDDPVSPTAPSTYDHTDTGKGGTLDDLFIARSGKSTAQKVKLLGFFFIGYIAVRCFFQPRVGPALPKEERATWQEKFVSLRAVALPMGIIIVVLGSIYSGICTATEAAALGVLGAVLSAAVHRKLTWQLLKESCYRTASLTAMIVWILIGAYCFTSVYTGTGAHELMEKLLLSIPGGRWAILAAIQLVFFILGCILDPAGRLNPAAFHQPKADKANATSADMPTRAINSGWNCGKSALAATPNRLDRMTKATKISTDDNTGRCSKKALTAPCGFSDEEMETWVCMGTSDKNLKS